MKTDKELLELAAKASGFALVFGGPDGDMPRISGCLTSWNPLTDDGDALRLAVKLYMLIDPSNSCVTTCSATGGFAEAHEDMCDDPLAATRRAIVRAAAAIGDQIK